MKIKHIAILLLGLLAIAAVWGIYRFFTDRNTIYIAMVGPLSGENKKIGNSFLQGIELYLDEINEKGGIKGRKIRLDIYDDQNNDEMAVDRALEIVKKNRAVGVVGHHFSACSIAAGEVYKEYQVPAVTPSSTNVNVTLDNDWYFRSTFSDKRQGRFLASYAKKVLNHDTASIICADHKYGSYLAEVIEQSSREMGIKIQHKWRFESPISSGKVLNIISDLQRQKDNAGVVFLATHAIEGVKIVKQMRDLLIENPVMVPDAFASDAFREGFSKYGKEINNPGFYSDGIYVTTPWISDTTDEKGQRFIEDFERRYERAPDWHSAFAYDTAMVLVEAIRAAMDENGRDIDELRQTIRSYLADLTNMESAIRGVTGHNYFDKNGDSQKPILVGVYRKGNIVSALSQIQSIPNILEVPNFKEAGKKGHVLFFDGQYSYKINVVYTGLQINEISEIDPAESTCMLDFFLWFRYQGDIDVRDIEFANAVNPLVLDNPIVENTKNRLVYRLYHVKDKFRMDFLPSLHVFGQHILGVNFRHRSLLRNNLIFVKDVLGMRLGEKATELDRMRDALNPSMGWRMDRAWFFQDISEKSSLGNPDHFNARQGTLQFSRFNVGVRIKADRIQFRRWKPGNIERESYELLVKAILVFSLVVTVFLAILVKGRYLSPHAKGVWFFQVITGFLLIYAGECYFVDWAADSGWSHISIEAGIRWFDMLWWMLSGLFLTMFLERFIWTPIEEKTGRTIPRIIRGIISLLIYMLAIFGIVAFVYDQALTSLLATSGVIAMIIGLAVQINIANIFSGIAINLERPFRIGDWIQIGDFKEGRVIDINWRATRVHTRDDTVLSIPNSQASESSIENFSYPNEGYWKYFTVHVDPSHPPERVKKVLLDAALSSEGVSNDPPPATRFLGMTAGMTGQSESWAANYLISTHFRNYGMKFAHNEVIWTNVWKHLKLAGIRHVMERQEVHMLLEGIKPKKAKMGRAVTILKEIDIFQPFSDKAKVHIAKKMKRHYFPPGQLVVRQGDEGDSLFIIVEGALGVWAQTDNGKSIEVARLGAGSFFGEMALLTGEPRTATIISITDVSLYEITKEDIYPLIKEEPEIFSPLSEVLSKRKMATEHQTSLQEDIAQEENNLATQILGKIQQFFGF